MAKGIVWIKGGECFWNLFISVTMTIFLLSDQEEPEEVWKHLSSWNTRSGTNHEDDSVNDGRKSRKERKVPMCEQIQVGDWVTNQSVVYCTITLHSQAQLHIQLSERKDCFLMYCPIQAESMGNWPVDIVGSHFCLLVSEVWKPEYQLSASQPWFRSWAFLR